MPKRVFIVHRKGSSPQNDWYPWLAKQLANHGVHVVTPAMPASADIGAWMQALQDAVGKLDAETFFVAHSTGCQAVLRYLAKQRGKAGGAVFVGGWLTLHDDIPNEETQAWLAAPLNIVAARRSLPKATAIFDPRDKHVPLENHEYFETNLGAKIVLLEKKGRLNLWRGAKREPQVLHETLELLG